MVATEAAWAEFQPKWSEMVRKHGFGPLHMADLMRPKCHPNRSWVEVRKFIVEAVNLVLGLYGNSKCFVREIDLAMYDLAKAIDPELKLPQALCVDYCLGQLAILIVSDHVKTYFSDHPAGGRPWPA